MRIYLNPEAFKDKAIPPIKNKEHIINTTYSELKSLVDNSQLIPGMQYRITDYITTTTQENTQSANHPFDIIVIADKINKLNCKARAVQHEGDSYFNTSQLEKWELWYDIENNTDKYIWADTVNGKGVIYRMIDEWDNDVPYDFKNIQFIHPNDAATYPHYYYTFSSSAFDDIIDNSLSITSNIYSNKILPYIDSRKQTINKILFFGSLCYNNTFNSNCHNITLDQHSCCNTFGSDCYNNYFDESFSYNSFGTSCSNNVFGKFCSGNIFGSRCNYNTFGAKCNYNFFSDNCTNNFFGDSCSGNFFGTRCNYIKFASDKLASIIYNYYSYNHFGDGCQYILFIGTETASSSSQVQNYNFAQGLKGKSNAYITIDGVRSRAYETKVAKNSNGEIKQYCEADLIL